MFQISEPKNGTSYVIMLRLTCFVHVKNSYESVPSQKLLNIFFSVFKDILDQSEDSEEMSTLSTRDQVR